jgi:hypothetical protein
MNYSHITPEAGMAMKRASGDNFPLCQVTGRASESSRTRIDDDGGYRTFRGWRLGL